MAKRVTINHPLLKELRRANKEAVRLFPAEYDRGLGSVGLILLPSPKRQFYGWCSPLNAWAFARTGSNGVHFSLLAVRNKIDAKSPVIVTNPAASGESLVVGENLFDFLCFGMYRGYFALEQLAYYRDLTLHVYTDPTWQPSESWHSSVGFEPDLHAHRLLAFLIGRFGLKPWKNARRFDTLQKKFASLMVMPPDLVEDE